MTRWVIWLSRLVLLFVGLQFLWIAIPRRLPPPPETVSAAAPQHTGWFNFKKPGPAGPNPAVWVVEDADSRIYLFGTIHVLQPGTQWQSETFLSALNNSDSVWIETRFDDETPDEQARLQRLGTNPRQRLTSTLPPEHRARLIQVAADMEIPLEALELTEPWLASLVIGGDGLQFGGYRTESGVEFALQRAAGFRGLPVREMEETGPHMRLMSDLPAKVQEAMLVSAMYSGSSLGSVDRVVSTWIKGDTSAIAASTQEMKVENPELYAVLIERRNSAWADKIEQMLEGSENHLVAVGAGHLVGPDSVQAKLATRGVRARRLQD
ncbi:MAG TPA: TraB/GumN family protein [Phenylobacterium sp.]